MISRLFQIIGCLISQTLDRDILPLALAPSFYCGLFSPKIRRKSRRSLGIKCVSVAEKLGPLFIKAGQFISSRPDLFPQEFIDEISQLRDNVAPLSENIISRELTSTYGPDLETYFSSIDMKPLASASIAQVHGAITKDGDHVVIKIRRPDIIAHIDNDITFLRRFARLISLLHPIKHLRINELLDELHASLTQELHLLNEAGHYAQMRQNFADSENMYVPMPYWDLCHDNAIVVERVYGTPISDIKSLKKQNVDLKYLAREGVIIFFTQLLRDSYFHADMHPGNIFIDSTDPLKPRYMAVDFGIMGYLSEQDRHYISRNLKAFFNRDYRQIAMLHIESGWVPADTRLFDFESSIRGVCEPLMDRPLSEISFARILHNLLSIGGQYHMQVQPQLLLLQKTLFNIEGLGRTLDPELNLHVIAKPFIDEMTQDPSIKDQLNHIKEHLPGWLKSLKPTAQPCVIPPQVTPMPVWKYTVVLTLSVLAYMLDLWIASVALIVGFSIAL